MPKRSHSPSVGEMTMRGLCAHTGMATPACDHGPLGVSDTIWLMYLQVSVDVVVIVVGLDTTWSMCLHVSVDVVVMQSQTVCELHRYMTPNICARHMRTLERNGCAEQGCNCLHPRIPLWHMVTILWACRANKWQGMVSTQWLQTHAHMALRGERAWKSVRRMHACTYGNH
jgi:hypothetical protein